MESSENSSKFHEPSNSIENTAQIISLEFFFNTSL